VSKKKPKTYQVPQDLEALALDIVLSIFKDLDIELEPDEAQALAPVLKATKKKPRKGQKGR